MPQVGFEPSIPASERPQTHALDRSATGTGIFRFIIRKEHKVAYYHKKKLLMNQAVHLTSLNLQRFKAVAVS